MLFDLRSTSTKAKGRGTKMVVVQREPPNTRSQRSTGNPAKNIGVYELERRRKRLRINYSTLIHKYSQTSVIEHNPLEKAVRKVICSKSETIFLIGLNVNNFDPIQV